VGLTAAFVEFRYNPPDSEWDNYFLINSKIPALVVSLKNSSSLPDGTKILWASTDMVFDGDHAPYSSTSERNPITIYGISKKSGEDALLGSALVVRFPQLYGLGGTFFQSIYDNLLKNDAKLKSGESIERIKLFGDEWRSVALASDVARMVVDFLQHSTEEDLNKVRNITIVRCSFLSLRFHARVSCRCGISAGHPESVALSLERLLLRKWV
jgi:dTDP-4-dehydrorhamnose reductase